MNRCTLFDNMFLIAVRQEVSSIDNSVAVHQLELAVKRDAQGRL